MPSLNSLLPLDILFVLLSFLVSYYEKNEKNDSKKKDVFHIINKIFAILEMRYGDITTFWTSLSKKESSQVASAILAMNHVVVGTNWMIKNGYKKEEAYSSFLVNLSQFVLKDDDFSVDKLLLLISGRYKNKNREITEAVEDVQDMIFELIST